MDRLRSFLDRLVPALIAAGGVALLAAGLMTVLDPAAAQAELEASPSIAIADPVPDAERVAVGGAVRPRASASASPSGSLEPSVASRVVVPAFKIDLPIVAQSFGPGKGTYPLCDVAQYLEVFGQPSEPGATYLYAPCPRGHVPAAPAAPRSATTARRMIGDLVQVYTDGRTTSTCTRSSRSSATRGTSRWPTTCRSASSGSSSRRARGPRAPSPSCRSPPTWSSVGTATLDEANPEAQAAGLPLLTDGPQSQPMRRNQKTAAPAAASIRPVMSQKPEPSSMALAASLMPKMPATAAMPARTHGHRGEPLHDVGEVVVDRREVGVEGRADQLAVAVELVGQPDEVVVDVAEVDDPLGRDERLVAVGELVEDLALRADRVADVEQVAPDLEEALDDPLAGLADDVGLELVDLVAELVEDREVAVDQAVDDGPQQIVGPFVEEVPPGPGAGCAGPADRRSELCAVSRKRWPSTMSISSSSTPPS